MDSNTIAQKPPCGGRWSRKLLLNQCSAPNADRNVLVFAVSHQLVVQVSSHGDADNLAVVFKISHKKKEKKEQK